MDSLLLLFLLISTIAGVPQRRLSRQENQGSNEENTEDGPENKKNGEETTNMVICKIIDPWIAPPPAPAPPPFPRHPDKFFSCSTTV